MSTINISLPDVLKDFVDRQVRTAGYGTSSEYVRELIRRDQERTQLRNLRARSPNPLAWPMLATLPRCVPVSRNA